MPVLRRARGPHAARDAPRRRRDRLDVRVVPNLYPAFERQEVVVHSPRHVRSFAELTDDEVAAVARGVAARARAARPRLRARVVNEGRAAGSSLPHSHSQLVWLAARRRTSQRARPAAELATSSSSPSADGCAPRAPARAGCPTSR